MGLHACADLSVTILEIFQQLDFVKSLIIMPCCYHRLETRLVSAMEETFVNFPTSKSLNELYKNVNGERFLRKPFLRLACQQNCNLWKNMSLDEHERHSRSCIFRAVLQVVANGGLFFS